MQLQISDWGNSLGLRIPKALAEMLGVRSGSKLKAELKKGKLILFPSPLSSLETLAEAIDLESVMKKVNARNRPLPKDDSPLGKEIW